MAVSPQLVGVVVPDLFPQEATPDLPTLTEATPPGPSLMEIFTVSVIVFQREEEGVEQVGVVREGAETTIQGEEGVDIGTEGTMTLARRFPD